MKCLRIAKSVALAMVLLAASQITFAKPDQNVGSPAMSPREIHAPAEHPRMAHANRHKDRKKKFAQALNLTQEQQVKIAALHQSCHKAHQPEMEAHRAQLEEIRKLKESGASHSEVQTKIQPLPKPDFEALRAEYDN